MNNDAETVIAALQSFLQGALGASFPTISRRLQFWDQTTEQPALFIRHNKTTDEWRGTGLNKTELELELWIYCRHGADDIPSTTVNALVKAVRNAMAPDNRQTNTFTIGGACYWCRVDGITEIYPGDTATQDIAIIPVRIILP